MKPTEIKEVEIGLKLLGNKHYCLTKNGIECVCPRQQPLILPVKKTNIEIASNQTQMQVTPLFCTSACPLFHFDKSIDGKLNIAICDGVEYRVVIGVPVFAGHTVIDKPAEKPIVSEDEIPALPEAKDADMKTD